MECVLHVQPIVRRINVPITIGHTEYLFYGEHPEEEGENPVGDTAACTRLGCPLEDIDCGQKRSNISLVKTFEFMPDLTRRSGNVYMDTIHYFKDQKYLIPLTTKIHSGLSNGLRVSHLPSLNFIRKDLTGLDHRVCESRSELVSELLKNDSHFLKNKNHPVTDWVRDDLIYALSSSQITDTQFDINKFLSMIRAYMSRIKSTPHELTRYHLQSVLDVIGLEQETIPVSYVSSDVLAKPVLDVRRLLVPHEVDLRSHGKINVDNLPMIDYNPKGFAPIMVLLDDLPVTDLNIDVVVEPDGSISFVHEHIVMNRLGEFDDNDIGMYAPESLVEDLIAEDVLQDILKRFVKHHSSIDDDLRNIICTEPIKIKIIKTIEDESLILLYRYNSKSGDDPLCGVHFDIALESLAPLSIIPETI